jgi:hypothetical protein
LRTSKDIKIFKKSNSLLSGANGIVYLLFVGRNNYAQNIQDLMTDKLVSDKSNINQIVHKLLESGKDFLITKGSYRNKGARGRARDIYTANTKPITATLQQFNIPFNEPELLFILRELSETADFFPKFLTNIFQTFVIRNLTWHQVLSMYFRYLSETLRAIDFIVYPIPSNFRINKETIEIVLKKNPSIRKDLISFSSQLSSPWLGLNPEFKANIDVAMAQLDLKGSELMKAFEFLKTLQNEGITDFSILQSQAKEVMTVYEHIDEIKSKLKEVDIKLEKMDKSNLSA